jgi:LysR family transcriptional regulator, glycine cleavage system transcriptional activator
MSLPLVRLSFMDLLRGFVAVGRRMSITLAAQDLCLTQSAVSRQINALEEQLGVKLLVRGHRSILFTPDGARLFRSADSAVQQLQDVLGEIRSDGAQRPVVLSACIGFTGLWLLPRLSRFQQLHPGVDLRVSANNRVVDLRHEGIDLAVRYTSPSLVPSDAVHLFGESVAPVVHPSLGIKSLRSAQALAKAPLLEFDDPQRPWLQWADWIGAAGWSTVKPHSVLHFNQYDQVIQAALNGQGIALGRLELIRPLLDAKRLIQLAPPNSQTEAMRGYWLIQANDHAKADVHKVAAWIEDEARSISGARPLAPQQG